MPADFRETIIQALEGPIRERILQGAAAGLDAAAGPLEAAAEARARDMLRGQTGATFAGIVAYVVGGGVEGGSVLGEAAAQVADRNPEHVLVQVVETVSDDEVALVLTVPHDYADKHVTEGGGQRDYLGAAFQTHVGDIADAVAQGIAQVLR